MSEPYRLVIHRRKYSLAYSEPELWRARSAPASDRVADLWEAYVEDRKQAAARTDRFASLWRALRPHFGDRIGQSVTADDCRAYHRARKRAGMSDSTVRTELEFLRACLRFKYGVTAPRLWIPPASKPREAYLTKQDARAVLAAIDTPHVRLFVQLALATTAANTAVSGLRSSTFSL